MKALVAKAIGPFREVLELQQIAAPRIEDKCVIIAVESCGISFPDVLRVEGRHVTKLWHRPFVPGLEVCGRVIEIGLGVKGIKLGDRVFGAATQGGLVEFFFASKIYMWFQKVSIPMFVQGLNSIMEQRGMG
eukprot:m.384824 g.384824  ORF g.384824 m.384824 type:complete len:132 (+) comp21001_c0_seq2:298-693(+)